MAYGAVFSLRVMRGTVPGSIDRGRAFDLRAAVPFAGTLTVVLVASAALDDRR